jgi:hypothetical protein
VTAKTINTTSDLSTLAFKDFTRSIHHMRRIDNL